jgi:mxaC protein
MSFDVIHSWVLMLLPLALLPLLRTGRKSLAYSWLPQLPPDPMSDVLEWLLRSLGVLALAALILGLAGLYRSEESIQRIGRGAQIVLLLDRSSSMDQPFNLQQIFDTSHPSKENVARGLLAKFVAGHPEDMFGLVEFSTNPIRVLDFTQKQDVIQAAIAAAGIGRGLWETDMGRGLEAALDYFAGIPYTGSRVIVLVSDGGANLDPETGERIANLMRRYRVGLYWLYIRSFRSPGLFVPVPPRELDTMPELALNAFFKNLGTPYHPFEADNPHALQQAIADIGQLENHPLRYEDILPRRNLSEYCFGASLLCCVILLLAKSMEVMAWR